jgi:hypothetical protein
MNSLNKLGRFKPAPAVAQWHSQSAIGATRMAQGKAIFNNQERRNKEKKPDFVALFLGC